jgi:hypothetical protein
MNLIEALYIYASLEEATLSQVIRQINKHKEASLSPSELGRLLATDGSLKSSLDVQSATPEEQKQYAALMKDPKIESAMKTLPTALKGSLDRLQSLKPSEQAMQTQATAIQKPNEVGQLDPQTKKTLALMQNQWFQTKDANEKSSLAGMWSQDSVKSRLYKYGLNRGIFIMPKVSSAPARQSSQR